MALTFALAQHEVYINGSEGKDLPTTGCDTMKFDADIHMFFRMNSNDLGDPHSKYLPLNLKLHFVFSAE